MSLWLLGVIALVLLVVVGSALGLASFVRQQRLLARIGALEHELRALRPPAATPPVAEEIAPAETPVAPAPAPAPAPDPPPAADRARPSLEQRLASRWMVWLGGVTLALAVVLFLNYAIEHAWLSPPVRVLLGGLFGAGLIAAGNLAAAAAVRDLSRRLAGGDTLAPNFVPAALTGAGLFALYASVEVAYAFYGLLAAPVAFAALAAVGFLGMTLALRHGWLVAVLGMIGACLAPALIASEQPSALTLFVYLAAVTGFALWLAAAKHWPRLAAAAWAGAYGWALVWMRTSWSAGDELVLGPYILAVGIVSALFPPRLAPLQALPWWPGRAPRPDDAPAGALVGLTLAGAMVFALLHAAGHAPFAVLVLAAFVLVAALMQDRNLVDGRLAVVAGALVVAAILAWPSLPAAEAGPAFGRPVVSGPTGLADLLAADPRLVLSALGLCLLVWGAGVLAVPRNRDPELAAGAAAAVPLLVHVVLYHRLGGFQTSATWAGIAVAIALANLWAASRAAALRGRVGDAPLSAFAAAVTGALALALACLLRDAWLPVSLSAEALALAWIATRLPVRGLRVLAAVVGVATVALLLARVAMVGGQGPIGRVVHVAYGYGLPWLMLWTAKRLLAPPADGWPGRAADAAVAGLGVLTGSLAIHYGLADAAGIWAQPLAELALLSAWWLVAGTALLARAGGRRPVLALAGNGLVAWSLATLVAGCALAFNPLVTGAPVGRLPVFSLLGLAYLLPALLLAVTWSARPPDLAPALRRLLPPVAGLLVFIWLSLETLRLFQGSRLHLRLAGEAELYAVSIVWLAYALALLAAAFRFDLAGVRTAALAVLAATILKVFLLDLASLSGLMRVGSFLALGLVLVGVGEVYRRYFRTPPP